MSPRPDVAIVSANFGHYDRPVPQVAQDIEVEWFMFTDEPSADIPSHWTVVGEQANGVSPNMAAKRHKLLSSLPHRYVIWIDANVRIQSGEFAREALIHLHHGVALHAHPFRDCIYQEALETILTPKYDAFPIAEQIRHYEREDNHPIRGGLFACGIIAWDREHPKAKALGPAWMAECERWSPQDQLSFPVVCRRLRLKPGVFPFSQYQNPWLKIRLHLK